MHLDKEKFAKARNGKTMTQLAKEAGVNFATVSNLNCGKSTKYETIKKLADALGVDVMSLVKED